VIVEPVQDLHAAAISQRPVGEIGLPAFVGLISGEAAVGAFRAFTWLRGDQGVVVQDAPNRRCRGHRQAPLGQMPLQGHRAGVEPVTDELLAQRHDSDNDLVGYGAGVAGGAP
jgi:hypothetical protein